VRFICLHLPVCECLCMWFCVFLCLSDCVDVCPCVSVCMSVCVCVYVGGTDSTEWEDITGSTQMTVVKGCVSFTSAVSARSEHTSVQFTFCPLSATVIMFACSEPCTASCCWQRHFSHKSEDGAGAYHFAAACYYLSRRWWWDVMFLPASICRCMYVYTCIGIYMFVNSFLAPIQVRMSPNLISHTLGHRGRGD